MDGYVCIHIIYVYIERDMSVDGEDHVEDEEVVKGEHPLEHVAAHPHEGLLVADKRGQLSLLLLLLLLNISLLLLLVVLSLLVAESWVNTNGAAAKVTNFDRLENGTP